MQLIPYLNFKGECEAAFKFYEKCFEGKIEGLFRYSEIPASDGAGCEGMSDEMKNWVMHASLRFNDNVLMGSDCPPEQFQPAQGTSLNLSINDPTKAEKIFNELADGGKVIMPFAQTFWAHRFGMAVDKFGTPWMINCEKPA